MDCIYIILIIILLTNEGEGIEMRLKKEQEPCMSANGQASSIIQWDSKRWIWPGLDARLVIRSSTKKEGTLKRRNEPDIVCETWRLARGSLKRESGGAPWFLGLVFLQHLLGEAEMNSSFYYKHLSGYLLFPTHMHCAAEGLEIYINIS